MATYGIVVDLSKRQRELVESWYSAQMAVNGWADATFEEKLTRWSGSVLDYEMSLLSEGAAKQNSQEEPCAE